MVISKVDYLSENDKGTPKRMADNSYVRFSRSYITQRCKKLVNHDLLRHLGNGVYVITEEGDQYLEGELDAADLVPDSG